jgi:hypothetical protein
MAGSRPLVGGAAARHPRPGRINRDVEASSLAHKRRLMPKSGRKPLLFIAGIFLRMPAASCLNPWTPAVAVLETVGIQPERAKLDRVRLANGQRQFEPERVPPRKCGLTTFSRFRVHAGAHHGFELCPASERV